ncbi:DUF397 domain-containing protein [Streptomyces halobius]|uniref:DUF397 domain-containing protein n=1 Tax=Streptomyces halobius TaxID=2879846 RepID=A0ABY4MA52_9ACTN|nr:DUF397 domain-containing protein [Streptomyces halobius]UQA94590.1 DUF397 domain-containing protein [Streptomyces halobius]
MSSLNWQQSSYCAEGGSCLALTPSPGGESILLRESEHPEAVLSTTPGPLGAFIRAVHTADQPVGTSR